MRNIIMLPLLFGFNFLFSQKKLGIIYKQDNARLPFTVNGQPQTFERPSWLLIIDDSLSFSTVYAGKKKLLKEKAFGEKIINHANLFNKHTRINYSAVNWDGRKYIVADTSAKLPWLFLDSSKIVAGYECKLAIRITENNDTLLVWYTPKINEPFGPLGYNGFPGLVMEVIDQRTNTHFYCDEIIDHPFTVVFPQNATIIYAN